MMLRDVYRLANGRLAACYHSGQWRASVDGREAYGRTIELAVYKLLAEIVR